MRGASSTGRNPGAPGVCRTDLRGGKGRLTRASPRRAGVGPLGGRLVEEGKPKGRASARPVALVAYMRKLSATCNAVVRDGDLPPENWPSRK